jgi:hypothetical protein
LTETENWRRLDPEVVIARLESVFEERGIANAERNSWEERIALLYVAIETGAEIYGRSIRGNWRVVRPAGMTETEFRHMVADWSATDDIRDFAEINTFRQSDADLLEAAAEDAKNWQLSRDGSERLWTLERNAWRMEMRHLVPLYEEAARLSLAITLAQEDGEYSEAVEELRRVRKAMGDRRRFFEGLSAQDQRKHGADHNQVMRDLRDLEREVKTETGDLGQLLGRAKKVWNRIKSDSRLLAYEARDEGKEVETDDLMTFNYPVSSLRGNLMFSVRSEVLTEKEMALLDEANEDWFVAKEEALAEAAEAEEMDATWDRAYRSQKTIDLVRMAEQEDRLGLVSSSDARTSGEWMERENWEWAKEGRLSKSELRSGSYTTRQWWEHLISLRHYVDGGKVQTFVNWTEVRAAAKRKEDSILAMR